MTLLFVFLSFFGQASASTNTVSTELAEIRTRLRTHLKRLTAETKVPFGTDSKFPVMQPAAPGGYYGLWPDDWYFPNRLMPELQTKDEALALFRFLTAAVENAPVLPDRVEPNGHLVFQPGPEGRPHGVKMPAHLPAAWTRLIMHLTERTGERALAERWRGVVTRSLARLELINGLVWLSDKEPQVGFGFYDTVGLAGNDLMSNLVLERGFRRIDAFFGGEVGASARKMADSIRDNLRRLRSNDGWYLSDSAGCRQFSPWSNGLAYCTSCVSEEDRRRIREAILSQLGKVTCRGQVRHCPETWRAMNRFAGDCPPGRYMNGGYWAVGTAYVLKAVYDSDPPTAVRLLGEMLAALEKSDFAEWESGDGKSFGARKFMMSVALPLAAVESILDNRPLIELF